MIRYKNRNIDIDQSLIDRYEEIRGRKLNSRDISIYIHAAYIDNCEDPERYAFALPPEELNATIKDMIETDIYLHS